MAKRPVKAVRTLITEAVKAGAKNPIATQIATLALAKGNSRMHQLLSNLSEQDTRIINAYAKRATISFGETDPKGTAKDDATVFGQAGKNKTISSDAQEKIYSVKAVEPTDPEQKDMMARRKVEDRHPTTSDRKSDIEVVAEALKEDADYPKVLARGLKEDSYTKTSSRRKTANENWDEDEEYFGMSRDEYADGYGRDMPGNAERLAESYINGNISTVRKAIGTDIALFVEVQNLMSDFGDDPAEFARAMTASKKTANENWDEDEEYFGMSRDEYADGYGRDMPGNAERLAESYINGNISTVRKAIGTDIALFVEVQNLMSDFGDDPAEFARAMTASKKTAGEDDMVEDIDVDVEISDDNDADDKDEKKKPKADHVCTAEKCINWDKDKPTKCKLKNIDIDPKGKCEQHEVEKEESDDKESKDTPVSEPKNEDKDIPIKEVKKEDVKLEGIRASKKQATIKFSDIGQGAEVQYMGNGGTEQTITVNDTALSPTGENVLVGQDAAGQQIVIPQDTEGLSMVVPVEEGNMAVGLN